MFTRPSMRGKALHYVLILLLLCLVSNASATTYGRQGDRFLLTPEQMEAFRRDGCVTIPDVLTENEVQEIEKHYNMFLDREIDVPGRDFCDMSQPFGAAPYEDWNMVNAMLPTQYHPPLRDNIYERLAQDMANQLYDCYMEKDYDQLLAKRPYKDQAVFYWHQDMAYWPGPKALGIDRTDTCTCSLAVDDSSPANGCLRYVVGRKRRLRPHRPVYEDRSKGHALTVDLCESDVIRAAPARRGSVTLHDEYVVHGSGGNPSPWPRRTYVVAFRAQEIVQAERRIGFTHSHNDVVNWDTFGDGEGHRVAAKDVDSSSSR